MFCPECKAEYREGIAVCSDCKVPLVAELPEEAEPAFVDFEEVLRTYNPADIAFIKSLLAGENITYLFQGEFFNQMEGPVVPARLLVRKDQAALAKEILQGTQLTFMAIEKSAPTEENESTSE
jgi:Putative prokaryotic signal transducing protein